MTHISDLLHYVSGSPPSREGANDHNATNILNNAEKLLTVSRSALRNAETFGLQHKPTPNKARHKYIPANLLLNLELRPPTRTVAREQHFWTERSEIRHRL